MFGNLPITRKFIFFGRASTFFTFAYISCVPMLQASHMSSLGVNLRCISLRTLGSGLEAT